MSSEQEVFLAAAACLILTKQRKPSRFWVTPSLLFRLQLGYQFSCSCTSLAPPLSLLCCVSGGFMEHIIQLVKDHPVLYDTSHDDYMKGKLKDEIWDKIAKEMNYTSGQMAKAQWKKVRDCYRDALRRQTKKKSEQGASAVRPWIYQKQMEFLLPFMKNRNTENSVSTIQAEVDEEVDDYPEENYWNNEMSVTDLLEKENSQDLLTLNRGNNKKIKMCSFNETISSDCIENYETQAKTKDELRKSMDKPNESTDPLYQFFMSMYYTTKTMPLPYQLRVKRKVFQAVSEVEEEIISTSHSS